MTHKGSKSNISHLFLGEKKEKTDGGDFSKRIIFHLDMDHFYTAVEERERPELKGKPVIVGADPKEGKGRGVVSTSNYEARKAGVRSGMPISRAWKLCPKAVYLPPNFPLYVKVSNGIMQIARHFAGKFEQWGIDEAFLDVTTKVSSIEEARNLAVQIKNEIKAKEGLTCSIGIGPNKLVAKIASDFHKPDGLTIVKEEDTQAFLAPLPVRKLLWVGKKTEQKLKPLGVTTVEELARLDPTILTEIFGVIGLQLHLMARGIDNSAVEERREIKSISHETTFEEDSEDIERVLLALEQLSEAVAEEAKNQNLVFKTVTIKLRYENFETHNFSKTLNFQTNRAQGVTKVVRELFEDRLKHGRKIRLVGVRVSSLQSGVKQRTLV